MKSRTVNALTWDWRTLFASATSPASCPCPWGFYVFAIAAVIAALALTIVPAMAPKGEPLAGQS